jgi:predicted site-specific integrase-resolvase
MMNDNNIALLNMRLYSLNGLSKFGIGKNTLKQWANAGILIPFTKINSQYRYRYQDFISACNANKVNDCSIKPNKKSNITNTKFTKLKNHDYLINLLKNAA